jgi:CDP-2,3-bis-(O-geranylgeranyl)-sn-glycerol synthase
VAPLIGLDWKIGALVALMAMSGDLVSSFVKRRMGRPPSSRAIGLDQVPESLLPLLACTLFLPLGFLDVMVTVTLFFIGELALSRVLFKLHIRNRPY